MRTTQAVTIQRSDYEQPSYLATTVHLRFELQATATRVINRTVYVRKDPQCQWLRLDGDGLRPIRLTVNGQPIADPQIEGQCLIVPANADQLEVEVETQIDPQNNTSLMGLYRSQGNYFTQCEAQGFRRITYALDRPDVMAIYTVVMLAEIESAPVLLSNGNLKQAGQLHVALPPGVHRDDLKHLPDWERWHWAVWEDPFPKPTYLFALVAGTLVATQTHIEVDTPPRRALLQVWVEPGNEDKTQFALESLVRAIRWDEKRFGLPLDLERFMIVAVGDFNMGAMENKGLNIFNTKYVFAHPRMATDTDFSNVEAVVGHEYFHNWTGNRVTCRDWFQLTLKEGLTVFRDQEFSADMMADQLSDPQAIRSARAVKRIDDVRVLRSAQFAEDAGPMAHPIRPESYQEINNFYTVTVYEKGAEVIRMLHTLVGEAGFRRGMDLYFKRHDGQAVTCDDFVAAIADANGRSFDAFRRWYSQAGTPHVRVLEQWDPDTGAFALQLSQTTAATPGQAIKLPFHIPLALGLLGPDGQDLPLNAQADKTIVLELTEASQTFTFGPFGERPVVSLGRNFSAPVVLQQNQPDAQVAFLAAHDSDPFNRWEACQRLATQAILAVQAGIAPAKACQTLIDVFGLLLQTGLDRAYLELCFTLPPEGFIAEQLQQVDPWQVRLARKQVQHTIATSLLPQWKACYQQLRAAHLADLSIPPEAYSPDPLSAGRRALANLALHYWMVAEENLALIEARKQLAHGTNLTDRFAALSLIANSQAPDREPLMACFAQEFDAEDLVLDKWFQVQATAHRARSATDPDSALAQVRRLMQHPQFKLRNPNRARALISSYCQGNLAEFHRPDGAGYAFWAEQVLALDAINPQVAARLARALDRWPKFVPELSSKMRAALEVVRASPTLSADVQEIIDKAISA
jgi:aminopeptidase N